MGWTEKRDRRKGFRVGQVAATLQSMRSISIQEPHISRIMRGEKTLEVRSKPYPWVSAIGETIALHGAANPPGPHAGLVVGMVTVLDVRPFHIADEVAACCALKPDHFVLVLSKVVALRSHFKASGARGLWELPASFDAFLSEAYGTPE